MENQELPLDYFEQENSNEDYQYLINTQQFVVLSIATLGLYELWWAYKAWSFFKQREATPIMPAARAILGIFYLPALFSRILRSAKQLGYTKTYSPAILYIAYLLITLLSRLPPPFFLISLGSVICLILPFEALNYLKRHTTIYTIIEQTSFNRRQTALLILGALFWTILLIGIFLS